MEARAKRAVAVVAHPDDESYAFAGTLAMLVSRGWSTRVISLTCGERGTDRSAAGGDLGAKRRAELKASCDAIGTEGTVLGFPDGDLAAHERSIAERLRPLLVDAEVVLTHGEDGGYGHPDHLACSRAVRAAAPGTVLHAAFPRGAFAGVHRALRRRLELERSQGELGTERHAVDHAIDVRPFRAVKLASLAAHVSQLTRPGDPLSFLIDGFVEPLLDEEWLVHAAGPRVDL